MNRKTVECLVGAVLIGISLYVLFTHTYVISWNLSRIGMFSTSGLLMLGLVFAIINLVKNPSTSSKLILAGVIALIVLSFVSGMHLIFRGMNLFDVLVILGGIVLGLSLVLKHVI